MSNEQFIVHDFQLPNHANELSKAEEIINKLKHCLAKLIADNSIDDDRHDFYYEETVKILDKVGKLSIPVFEIEDELEAMYVLKFPHSPELAKKIWQDHYDEIHHPYSILKNRCYRILEELDAIYQKKFKKNPPNWEI